MIRNRNGYCPFRGPSLHHYVASPASNFNKPMPFKNLADLRPERTRSLPMRRLESRHEYLGVKAAFDLLGISALEEELDSFL